MHILIILPESRGHQGKLRLQDTKMTFRLDICCEGLCKEKISPIPIVHEVNPCVDVEMALKYLGVNSES